MKELTKIAVVVVLVLYFFQCVICATALQNESKQLKEISESLQETHGSVQEMKDDIHGIREELRDLVAYMEAQNEIMGR